MHQQMNKYFESLLSKFQCGFRQGLSAQHCLLGIVEKMKKRSDSKGGFAAVLTNLFKDFDCIPHGLLIAKLNAFGPDKNHCRLFLPICIMKNKKLRQAQNLVIF